MAISDYIKASKLGKKDYQNRLMRGELPTLEVLDNILQSKKTLKEVSLGLVDIPLNQVVGTKTYGRSSSFSSNFMPLLDSDTEFASKWINLSISQENEGIRDPIKAYEYMNKFYVLEGNKRVSVLKYFGAVSIAAEVTRIIPEKDDTKESKIYYEFMDFYDLSQINYIYFTKPGSFIDLQRLTDKEPDEKWSDSDKSDFNSLFSRFQLEYNSNGGSKLEHITEGDAFLSFIRIHGYKDLLDKTSNEICKLIVSSWEEFELLDKKEIDLRMTTTPKKTFSLSRLLPTSSPKQKVAFIYSKTPELSSWVYSHELGRLHLEQTFPDEVETIRYDNVTTDTIDDCLNSAIDEGCNIIFTTSPSFLQASVKAAIANPKINILNCSLHAPHSSVRTYYSRMYEAKFIMGAIAGAMTDCNKIMYIADYPIYGTIANINSFALGVKTVNPRAKVYLEWSSLKDSNINDRIREIQPDCISDRDLSTPELEFKKYGLYKIYGDNIWNLAVPLYHWGNFYSQLISNIMDGTWKSEDSKSSKAINYWWGMPENTIEIITSQWLPEGIKRLISLLSNTIRSGSFNPFTGIIHSQNGIIQNREDETLAPDDIITMDWLSDNITGRIPDISELEDNAKPVTIQQGIKTQSGS